MWSESLVSGIIQDFILVLLGLGCVVVVVKVFCWVFLRLFAFTMTAALMIYLSLF